jgi:osmotically-inducible protein OsmY
MLTSKERIMAQNYRNQSGQSDESRGGRYQGGSERDRYRTGGEQHSSGDWYNRSRGFPSEESGYRRDRNRDEGDREQSNRNYQTRGSSGASYPSERSYRGDYERENPSRYDEGRFDENTRWQSAGEDDYGSEDFLRNRGTSTTRWQEDENDQGGYFGTGSYADDRDASQGFQRDFYRARAQQERDFGSYRDRKTSDYGNYGRSYYGSQPNYERGQEDQSRQWRGQRSDYENRNYGNQSGGSQGFGQSSGSRNYGGGGRDIQGSSRNYAQSYGQSNDQNYRSASGSQSFRGRGPQGYQRSDERLKEMICERLTDDPNIDASNVTIDVTSQIVKLSGTVDDRSTKYEIEELVERMGGVKDIDNQLRVQSSRSGSQFGSQQSSTSQSASPGTTGQQQRGGSDWEAGSSSTTANTSRSTGTSSGASTSGSPSSGSTTKRN